MLLDEFNKYNSFYEKGAKKISIRTSYPFVERVDLTLTIKKSYGNYDLFFNRKGLLLHSVHNEERDKFKVIYGYNKGMLISAMKLVSEKNELISLSEFMYDEKGRIKTETVLRFHSRSEHDVIKHHFYTYTDNKKEVFMVNEDYDDEDEYTIFTTYDHKQREIEDKAFRNEDELIFWYKNEYDKDDNLIKVISLNELGETEGVYEYFTPFKKGFSSGYNYKSKDSSYLKEFSYTFNEKGHWINEVMIIDGEPKYFFDRTIEYY